MPHSAFVVHEILSGRRRGVAAALARFSLLLVSWPWRAAVALRNRLYDHKLRPLHSIDKPVISIGNITSGGTGKTPLVEYLARYLVDAKKKVVIISRGYGSVEGEPNDEEKLLAENLPGVPLVADRDRVVCAVVARRKYAADVVLMDDGFQHRRLRRNLDIVAVDATNPFGFGYSLPRGLLRESPQSLSRADVVVVTRTPLVKPEEIDALEAEIARLAPKALLVRAAEDVLSLDGPGGASQPLDSIAGKRVVAFCGIGNPEAFRRTVALLGVQSAAFLVFGDHQRYTSAHLRAVDNVAGAEKADLILTTQKDRVKLPADFQWQHPLLVVRIGVRLTRNEAELKRRLDEVTAQERPT